MYFNYVFDYGYFLDAAKFQVLGNLLFVLDTEVSVMIWFSLRFTAFLNQLIKSCSFKIRFYKIKMLIFAEYLDLTVFF